MACGGCGNMTKAQKIGSIVTGWKNVIWHDSKTEKEAMRRVEICSDCGSNWKNVCLQCSCFIPAKARSMKESCPISKW